MCSYDIHVGRFSQLVWTTMLEGSYFGGDLFGSLINDLFNPNFRSVVQKNRLCKSTDLEVESWMQS
jgi:hypothetical protein